jgi:hypothetical protein
MRRRGCSCSGARSFDVNLTLPAAPLTLGDARDVSTHGEVGCGSSCSLLPSWQMHHPLLQVIGGDMTSQQQPVVHKLPSRHTRSSGCGDVKKALPHQSQPKLQREVRQRGDLIMSS